MYYLIFVIVFLKQPTITTIIDLLTQPSLHLHEPDPLPKKEKPPTLSPTKCFEIM
jgi:hypothetical protein